MKTIFNLVGSHYTNKIQETLWIDLIEKILKIIFWIEYWSTCVMCKVCKN